jgi:hypothetical protein
VNETEVKDFETSLMPLTGMPTEDSGGAGIQPLGSDEPNTIYQTFIKLACDIAI